jgi:hypothetical protein
MWLEVVIDVLWPGKGPKALEASAERFIDGRNSGTLAVECWAPGAFKRRLNQSGWLEDEVIAAGWLEQGRTHSMFALLTGLALIQVVRRRRATSLPREFVLAVTADRVVALGLSPWKEGDGHGGDRVSVLKIKPGERGSWARGPVRLTDLHERVGTKGATLQLPGEEPFPVTYGGDPSTDELIEHLHR